MKKKKKGILFDSVYSDVCMSRIKFHKTSFKCSSTVARKVALDLLEVLDTALTAESKPESKQCVLVTH